VGGAEAGGGSGEVAPEVRTVGAKIDQPGLRPDHIRVRGGDRTATGVAPARVTPTPLLATDGRAEPLVRVTR
jgi:hypothetical protein